MSECVHPPMKLRWLGNVRTLAYGVVSEHKVLWCSLCGSIARGDGGLVLTLPMPDDPAWPRELQRPGASSWHPPEHEQERWKE